MSVTELSPTEQAEVDRFGIFDWGEIAPELGIDPSEIVPCVECDKEATQEAIIRCCRDSATFCALHFERARLNMTLRLGVLAVCGRRPLCSACGHRFPVMSMFDDVYAVGKL